MSPISCDWPLTNIPNWLSHNFFKILGSYINVCKLVSNKISGKTRFLENSIKAYNMPKEMITEKHFKIEGIKFIGKHHLFTSKLRPH